MTASRHFAPLLAMALLAGCATRSADVKPASVDPSAFAGWDCERLVEESDRVQWRAADVAYAVDARVGNNMIALGLGVTVFWPALLAMRPDGLEAQELGALKGRFEALQRAHTARGCPPVGTDMPANRAAALPVTTGERLVYEDRPSATGSPRELGLRITALRRDQIEFAVEVPGRAQAAAWYQDLAGNALGDERQAPLTWQRLLKPGLQLGQVVAGELRAAEVGFAPTRVRGQVVALGPQNVAGRHFDVAVIELFGDVPGVVGNPSTRLDGVMAVDRVSGLLLRLELRCDNPDYALRRRLLRVEAARG